MPKPSSNGLFLDVSEVRAKPPVCGSISGGNGPPCGGVLNLDLPFEEDDPAALDECVAKIDRELDAVFLNAIEGEMERLRAERVEQIEKKDSAA